MGAPLELHDYQHVGVDHLRRNPSAGLFLDMGLGKTAIVLRALRPEDLPVLVTATKRVTENVWETEARKWRPDLRIAIAAGTPARRAEALRSGADIVVISRDNLADAAQHATAWRTFVIDETSGFKSRGTARWRAARAISKRVAVRWGLTGTPSPESLLDLWAQMALIDFGERLGKTLGGYRKEYFSAGRQLPNGVVTRWDLKPGADKKIHTLLEDICLSMETEGRVKLPPRLPINFINVPMSPTTRALYKKMKRDLVVNMGILGGEVHTAANAAVLTSRLSQLVAGFMYVDDAGLRENAYDIVHTDKINAAMEVIDGTGSPVLVFYQFRAELEMLQSALGKRARTMSDKGVIEAWDRGDVPVLLAHPASAGHGLNLQHGGHTALWTTLPWSLEQWQQSNKRLHRQGQKNPVMTHVLMTPNSVDEAILARLVDKASVQDALLAHLESLL